MARSIRDILQQRIVVLDGAMGTMIQREGLQEADFRGEEFAAHGGALKGNNEMLVLTRPDLIAAIHRAYLDAGADIISTCTFGAQAISQAEYGAEHLVRRMNLAAAQLARGEAERFMAENPMRECFVAGSVGPTGKTASMSPDVDDPARRAVDFDALYEAYCEQIDALVEGGVDLLLVETAFDTLNVKAALAAAEAVFELKGRKLPIMLSATIADAAGRMLAGQTLEAMMASVAHIELLSVGLNCSFGAEQMIPYLKQLADAPYYVSAHPNAGMPDQMGHYDQTPERMARWVEQFMEQGLVNIVGGCCGTTPEHIRLISQAAARAAKVRQPSEKSVKWLAGLDAFAEQGAFINVGERCNVAGSRKFLRLISEKSYDEALSIARAQVRDGAMMLEIWEAFMTYCKSEGIATIVYKSIPHIYSPYPSEDDLYALFRQGAVLKEVNLSSTIDLRNPLGFNMSKRQQLRKAHKCDITISETDDYERFWEILSVCLAERHDSKPVHSIDEIRLLVSRFPDNIKLYAVSDDEGMQAGVCMFDTGHVFHSQYTATTAKARKNCYLTALYDYLINLGAGHAYFDFGISNEDRGAYLNEGLLNQKSSMGGQGVVYSIYEIKVK